MTTKAKFNIVINATQAAMLDTMRGAPEALCTPVLFAKMGISRGHGLKHMTGLRDQELVAKVSDYTKNHPAKWQISMAGRRALCDYKRKVDKDAIRAQAAPPPTRSIWGTDYIPASNAYYRNNGHTDRPSYGVRC
jgi:hypothetical protein